MNLNSIRKTLQGIKNILDGFNLGSGGAAPFDISKVPGNDIFPSDVQIYGFVISSKKPGVKPVDLLNLAREVNIYESIGASVVFATASIMDAQNTLGEYEMRGEEYVDIRFATPGMPIVHYKFRVMQALNRTPAQNNMAQQFDLVLASPDWELNRKSSVTPNEYDGLTYKEIVDAIVKNHFDKDGLAKLDDTIAHFTHGDVNAKTTFLNKAPFEAIDYCRHAAVSNEYAYSPYCFFQNQHGYNFITLANLINQAAANITNDKIFKYEKFDKSDFRNVAAFNIIAFNNISNFDVQKVLDQGALNSSITIQDWRTAAAETIKLTEAIGLNQSESFATMDPKSDSFTSEFQARIMADIDPSKPPLKLYTQKRGNITYLRQYAAKIIGSLAFTTFVFQDLTRVQLYGRSNITAGDGIICYLPNLIDSKEQNVKPRDRAKSGKYLVTKVRHQILINDRPGYTTILELAKVGWNKTGIAKITNTGTATNKTPKVTTV